MTLLQLLSVVPILLATIRPLIVVDGIPHRSLDRLDPSDIESFTVLKDASAAIYGTQAANGVILVTTKRGSIGKPTITLNANTGFNQPGVIPKMADAATYATMLNEIAYYSNPGDGRNQQFSADDITNLKTDRIHGDIQTPIGLKQYSNHGRSRIMKMFLFQEVPRT